MHILRTSIVSVLLLLGPGVVLAADVPVRYTVDAKALKLAVMGTPLSFELHATSACSAAISTSVVLAENVASIEQLKLLSPKGAPKPPKTARLGHVLTGVEPAPTYFLKVTGTGISPVGGACQRQETSGIAGNSGVTGYVWADQPSTASYTPAPLWQYNATGATNTITRLGTGVYQVTFPGLQAGFSLPHLGHVQVTAFGYANVMCNVQFWTAGTPPDEVVQVGCFNLSGTPTDSSYDVLFVQ